jgi:DNA-directed RNA polymerase beta subunit
VNYGNDHEMFNKDDNITTNLVRIINNKEDLRKYYPTMNHIPLKEIFRDGRTGRIIKTPIFIVPQFYQRLNKLSADTTYSNSNCRVNDITG